MADNSAQPTFDFSGGSGDSPAAGSNVPYTPQPVPGETIVAQQTDADRGGYKGVHPIAALFHVIFKIGALLTYILGGIFSANYIVKFVITVLCCAADFWVVKNVTGRILVALRWWNEVKDDGSTQWVFESAPEADNRVNAYDNWFFWVVQGVYTAAWLVLGIFSLLSVTNWPMIVAGFMLAGSNFLGYIKCRRDAKSRITQFMTQQAVSRPEAVMAAANAVSGTGAATRQSKLTQAETMMRRRLCVAAAVAHPVTAVRHQSHKGGDGSGKGGIHRFIRENRPAGGGGGDAHPSRGSEQHTQQRRGGGGRGGSGAGGATSYHIPSASTNAASSSGDWAAQLQQELFGEVDPLGGLAHKDYYRDPATGYSPQYAPRNFAQGGEVAYHHAQSPVHFAEASARRAWLEHDVESMSTTAREAARTAGRLRSGEERAKYLGRFVPEDRFASHLPENKSMEVKAQIQHSGPTSGEPLRQQAMVDRYQYAASSTSTPPLASSLSGAELRREMAAQVSRAYDDSVDEHLRIEYGLRAKERFDFTMMQRSTRAPFEGYDMDRYLAQAKGTPYAATQLPPGMQPSSMDEAQQNLRGGSGAGGADGEGTSALGAAAPSTDAYVLRAYARNTVTDEPKLDEALTEELVSGLRAREEAAEQSAEQARKRRFGLGRQGALVQDAGPDKRTQRKHTHDERLVHAAAFKNNAYRHHMTDEHVNPYLRGETTQGVGHLINNRFDLERREDRISHNQPDLTERSQMHLGVPIQQTVDEFVFRHRNARGERPLDYFKPFPDFRANRLSRMHKDTEGFSLMKQRPDFLEWELFTRYRAHHQQRRELALKHGLEPVANETAQERDARRLKLDKLCEQTPFDPSRMKLQDDEMAVDVETLRSWFGVYLLPSPTIVESVTGTSGVLGLHLQHEKDALGTTDHREHLLSSRYFNQLLMIPGYAQRLGRGFVEDTFGKAPEPVIKHAQPPEVLKHFTAEEQKMYQEYVHAETQKQLDEWSRLWQGKRYIPEKEQYGQVVPNPGGGFPTAVPVVDVQAEDTGAVMTISATKFEKELNAARERAAASASGHGSPTISIDGSLYAVVKGSERSVTPLTVRLDSGEVFQTTDEQFTTYPLEISPSARAFHHLNYGIHDYHYNRGNYVETQDALWEEATAHGVEGWSPATHVDGLRPGLPVRARRQLGRSPTRLAEHQLGATNVTNVAEENVTSVAGDFQRGVIVEYLHQPFFNPEPRTVTVAFASGTTATEGVVVEEIPLANVVIWQRQNYGPERTVGDMSRRYQPQGLRRYIDVADPMNEKQSSAAGAASLEGRKEHFLEKYEPRNDTEAKNKFRTTKQITEIDGWTAFDNRRPENYRPLSISHRRDYIRQGYMHKYTPWEWIAIQEADQPIIKETMRNDDLGTSHFFSLNRFWRYKARPHGYIRNFENEVRDLFQFVDGITPWKQAQKIRTYWEVRQHHPMPQFNRPEVAMHRNTAGLLPAHLWETDKKTGKVKAVKDSVRDYQTKTPVPKWVQL